MIQIISRFFRKFVFGGLPLFLFAGGSNDHIHCLSLENGTYRFTLSGVLSEQRIEGSAFFNSNMLLDDAGKSIKRLELNFKNDDCKDNHLIQFELSHKQDNKGIYKIENVERLFHGFNGVYGVADLGEQHELPFFVNTGSITILEIGSNEVEGDIEVKFKNATNETLFIKGVFNAKEKN